MIETGEKNIIKFKRLTRIASGLIMLAILAGCGRTAEPGESSLGDSDGAQAGLLENLAGSWRLDGQKTTEHLKAYDSLQAMWGTGLSYGSGMEIGADGSFSYYIAINYGGSGTVRETDGAILAELVPYAPEGNGGSPDSLLITPVVEDGVTYLTTPYDGELMYWERCDSKTGD